MKHTPLRSCIACRAQKDKAELVRIVRKPDGEITLDETGKLSGRGAYVCRDENCMAELIKKRALNRTFKEQVAAEVYEKLAEQFKNIGNE